MDGDVGLTTTLVLGDHLALYVAPSENGYIVIIKRRTWSATILRRLRCLNYGQFVLRGPKCGKKTFTPSPPARRMGLC